MLILHLNNTWINISNNFMNDKFIFEQASDLDYKTVEDYYLKYINPGLSNLYKFFSFGRDIFENAEGMYLYTKSKKKILDFTGGLGVLSHGHNHPRILGARIKFQQQKKVEVHKVIFSSYQALLAKKVVDLLPEGLNKVFFPNSGAEANEGAIKMAYKYHEGKRDYILHSDRAFHGKLIACGSLGGNYFEDDFFPRLPNTVAFEYNNIENLKSKIELLKKNNTSNIYAIILEPFSASCMQGCSEKFLLELRKICFENDIVLIFDEVYSGWAKTGELFNFMRVKNLCPDILTSSKSFGGGKASISAYISSDKVFMKAYGSAGDANLHSSTYTGFGEESATALEALDIMVQENYVDKSKNIFERINPKLIELKNKYPSIIKEVRGSGTMNGIVINPPIKIIDKILDLLPFTVAKNNYNKFSLIVIAGIMEYLYSTFNILTIPQDRIIRTEQGDIERFAYLAIKPSCIVNEQEIDFFIDSLDQTLSQGPIKLINNFFKNKLTNAN